MEKFQITSIGNCKENIGKYAMQRNQKIAKHDFEKKNQEKQ